MIAGDGVALRLWGPWSKLASNTWSNSLVTGNCKYLTASPRRHVLMFPPRPQAPQGESVAILLLIILSLVCRHDMETVSASLTLCEGNPPRTGGFPSQRTSDADLEYIPLCTPEQTVYENSDCSCYQQRKHQIYALLAHCQGTPPVTGICPSQGARNVARISIILGLYDIHITVTS